MEGNSQVNDVVYKCDVARPLPKNLYPRFVQGEWRMEDPFRFYNHKL